jgi:hypothetical protein
LYAPAGGCGYPSSREGGVTQAASLCDEWRLLPAGVVSSLVIESEQVESERQQVRTLALLARNVDPNVNHEISFAEQEYLGF